MEQSERRIFLIQKLLEEREENDPVEIPADELSQKKLLRALFNVRFPKGTDPEFLAAQDAYLREEIAAKGVTDAESLPPLRGKLCLWQGDITTLKCGAIVNAANSGMTGCWHPNHACIDNCIHTFAGIQLRLECARIMEAQGHPEETGRAKLTSAYNLPCDFVLHTVGPIISSKVTKSDRALLASCYTSCLALAAEHKIESVAFCCISTGEFRFPNGEAARIAVSAVESFLEKEARVKKVVFNVFKDIDREIYGKLLGGN